MSSVIIRALTPSDEPFLWEMLYQAIYVPPGFAPFPREVVEQPEIARYVKGWGRTGDSGFVAVDALSQQPVGATWIRLFTAVHPGYGYVNDATPELTIALLPDWRGRGVGSQLMTAMLAAARHDYAAVSLSVSATNPARRLYERCGFVTEKIEAQSLTMRCHFHTEEK